MTYQSSQSEQAPYVILRKEWFVVSKLKLAFLFAVAFLGFTPLLFHDWFQQLVSEYCNTLLAVPFIYGILVLIVWELCGWTPYRKTDE